MFVSCSFHIPEGVPAPVDGAHATPATAFSIIGNGVVNPGSGRHGKKGQGILIVVVGIQEDPELIRVPGLLVSFFTGGGNVAWILAKQSCSNP